MRAFRLALALAFLMACARESAGSNGLLPTANGPVQNGRGGVDTAIADSPLSMNSNPAGITRFDFLSMAGGLGIYLPEVVYEDADNPDGGEHSVDALYPIPNFAIVFGQDFFNAPTVRANGAKYFNDEELRDFHIDLMRMRQDRSRSHWSFGFGLFIQGGAGNHMNIRTRLFPDQVTYYSNFSLLSLTPTLAYQIGPKVSIGASLNLNYSTMKINSLVGQSPGLMKQIFDFSPFFGLPAGSLATNFADLFTQIHDPNSTNLLVTLADALGNNSPKDGARDLSGRFTLRNSQAYGLGGRFGILVDPVDWMSVGASYATRTWLSNYKGQARLDFSREIDALGTIMGPLTRGLLGAFSNPIETNVFQDIVGFYDAEVVDYQFPAVTSVGLSFHPPNEDWLLGVDVRYIQWADVQKDFKVRLTNGNNPLLNTAVASDRDHALFGSVAKDPSNKIETSLPLNLKNQWIVSIGGEYRLTPDLTVRGGYNFATDIIPEDTYIPIMPALVSHHASVGFSYQVFENTMMDMSYEHGFKGMLEVDRHLASDDLDGSSNSVETDTIWTGFTVHY